MPKHNHQPFENQIFNHYRELNRKEEEAIKYLQERGYVVSSKQKTYASSK